VVAQICCAAEQLSDLLGREARGLVVRRPWALDPQHRTGGQKAVGHRVVKGLAQRRIGAATSAGCAAQPLHLQEHPSDVRRPDLAQRQMPD
jgi:hypothetical protein